MQWPGGATSSSSSSPPLIRPPSATRAPLLLREGEALLGARPEAGFDECDLAPTVDAVDVAVEAVGEVEAVVAAADEVDVFRKLHLLGLRNLVGVGRQAPAAHG